MMVEKTYIVLTYESVSLQKQSYSQQRYCQFDTLFAKPSASKTIINQ